ncbi:MAG TPA: hypothetical protein VH518_10445 [Tepidisphaeraceae bacterium]|jgi:hypothetical protein
MSQQIPEMPEMPHPQPPGGGLMPLQPLTYETPMRAARPGILTAVGVLSIIFACLSVLMNCGSVVKGVLFGTLRNMTLPAPPVLPTPSQMTTPAPVINNSSLTDAQRQIVTSALDHVHSIPPARREMLDRLLAEAGDDMFPFAGDRFTDERITASVSDSGELAAETPGQRGNLYFVLGNGRIELSDDHASFSPSGGGQRLRVDRDEIDATAQTPIQRFPGATTVPFTMPASPFAGITGTTAMLNVLDGVLGLLLAIFLFIAGIMVLRDASSGRGMHLYYACLKIPLAMLGAVASWMLYTQMMKSFATMGAGSPLAFGTMTGGLSSVFEAVFACMYPVALLIVMNLQPIKDHYNERRAQGA